MAEYLERDSVLRSLAELIQMPFTDLDDAWEVVQKTPAADVVEVVRCEHCKFCSTVVDFIGNCQSFCGEYPTPRMVNPKDFCSRGEQKEATP